MNTYYYCNGGLFENKEMLLANLSGDYEIIVIETSKSWAEFQDMYDSARLDGMDVKSALLYAK